MAANPKPDPTPEPASRRRDRSMAAVIGVAALLVGVITVGLVALLHNDIESAAAGRAEARIDRLTAEVDDLKAQLAPPSTSTATTDAPAAATTPAPTTTTTAPPTLEERLAAATTAWNTLTATSLDASKAVVSDAVLDGEKIVAASAYGSDLSIWTWDDGQWTVGNVVSFESLVVVEPVDLASGGANTVAVLPADGSPRFVVNGYYGNGIGVGIAERHPGDAWQASPVQYLESSNVLDYVPDASFANGEFRAFINDCVPNCADGTSRQLQVEVMDSGFRFLQAEPEPQPEPATLGYDSTVDFLSSNLPGSAVDATCRDLYERGEDAFWATKANLETANSVTLDTGGFFYWFSYACGWGD